MAKRIILHYIMECDGAGCDKEQTRVVDGEADPQGRILPKAQAANVEVAREQFTEIKAFTGNRKRHLCPDCLEKLKGVFKAEQPVVPPAVELRFVYEAADMGPVNGVRY